MYKYCFNELQIYIYCINSNCSTHRDGGRVEVVLRSDVGGAGLAGGHGGGHSCNREKLKPPVIVIITRDTAGHWDTVTRRPQIVTGIPHQQL